MISQTLPKKERLSGKTAVGDLLKKGRWGFTANLKYCWLVPGSGDGCRIMVSVPKRNFKRAVKRNLLKRRLREGYRLQRHLLSVEKPIDIIFFYNTKEILESGSIHAEVAQILRSLSDKTAGL